SGEPRGGPAAPRRRAGGARHGGAVPGGRRAGGARRGGPGERSGGAGGPRGSRRAARVLAAPQAPRPAGQCRRGRGSGAAALLRRARRGTPGGGLDPLDSRGVAARGPRDRERSRRRARRRVRAAVARPPGARRLRPRIFRDRARGASGGRRRRPPAVGGPRGARQPIVERSHGRGHRGAGRGAGDMTLWQGLLLGLVQGLTEFLPVSSSGHLVLAEALARVRTPGVFVEVALHVATLGSVLVVYGARLARVLAGAARGEPEARRYLGLLVLGTVPAGVAGVLFHRAVEARFHAL